MNYLINMAFRRRNDALRPLLFFFVLLCGLELRAASPAADSLPPIDSLDQSAMFELLRSTDTEMFSLRKAINEKVAEAASEASATGEKLSALEGDSSSGTQVRDSLKIVQKQAQKTEKEAQSLLKEADNLLEYSDKIKGMTLPEQRKNAKKLIKKSEALRLKIYPPMEKSLPEAEKPKKEKKNPKKEKEATAVVEPPTADANPRPTPEKNAPERKTPVKKYDPREDVMLHPPSPPCTFSVDSRDEFSGELRRQTWWAELFRHTNPALKSAFKDKSHVVCNAAASFEGASWFLHLELHINEATARKTFGSLPKGANIVLKFIDGSAYNLYSVRAEEGVFDESGASVIYRPRFLLDAAVLKLLRKSELDKIRLGWSNGYEDYEVHYLNLVQRQLKCLGE